MQWLTNSLYHAAAMLWEMLWALVLGFGISACLQVFVSKEKMAGWLGKTGLRSVLLAAGAGAASSSCSYAAAATTNTLIKKGAAFVPALAFLIAATNLVIELGIVLWILMGWPFVAAELFGAVMMIVTAWLLVTLTSPKKIIEDARTFETKEEEGCGHEHGGMQENGKLRQVADAFFMDWSMLWKEILLGVLIAGFIMELVPARWWQTLFLNDAPFAVKLIENALVGPLIAMASFVCSVGNIPLASTLWSGGSSFGGVISFIYGDLIVFPLILAYSKYYGWKPALYLTGILYASMVIAGIVVELLFTAFHWVPKNQTSQSAMQMAHFSWNYTTWLDLAAIVAGAVLLVIHFQNNSGSSHSQHQH